MQLLVTAMEDAPGKILLATHSTAILSSLIHLVDDSRIAFKTELTQNLDFQSASGALRAIVPMFGAHPLSNIFNQRPPLIVEGEDDERIWQTAVRSSEGRISVFPCPAGNIQSMNEYEVSANQIINSVYEEGKAYSLRDRDDEGYEIADEDQVVRARLNCRAAENLIVTDDVLRILGTDWPTFQANFEQWLEANPDHSRFNEADAFRAAGFNRRDTPLKGLRLLLIDIAGSNKPWEVAVGQAIAGMTQRPSEGEHGLADFLGPKIVGALNLTPDR